MILAEEPESSADAFCTPVMSPKEGAVQIGERTSDAPVE
jgi:hypothetical protein